MLWRVKQGEVGGDENMPVRHAQDTPRALPPDLLFAEWSPASITHFVTMEPQLHFARLRFRLQSPAFSKPGLILAEARAYEYDSGTTE